MRCICAAPWPVCWNARTGDGLPGPLRMARATKNSISGGRLESEPRMTGLWRRRLDIAQGRGTVTHAARSGPMLRPSRGGGGRPHEGPAQARRELQRSHLEARRIENKRPKKSCASRPAAQFGGLEGEASLASCRRCRTRADPPEYLWPHCAIGRGRVAAHPDSLSSRTTCSACRRADRETLL